MVRSLTILEQVPRTAVCLLLLAIAVNFHSCAAYTPTLVRLIPFGADTKKAENGDLTVYVEGFVNAEKSQSAFDANMPAEGVLPILISVENTGRKPFDVNVADIHLRDETPFKRLAPEDAALRAQRSAAGRALGWSMIVPIITIPFAIGGSAIHTGDVNQQIVRDFIAKGLTDGAVLPNKQRSGFVYFEADGRKDVTDLILEVTVRNTDTGEPISVEMPLSQKSTEPLTEEKQE